MLFRPDKVSVSMREAKALNLKNKFFKLIKKYHKNFNQTYFLNKKLDEPSCKSARCENRKPTFLNSIRCVVHKVKIIRFDENISFY